MGLEPKESLVGSCLLLSALATKVLEFQGFERVSLANTEVWEM